MKLSTRKIFPTLKNSPKRKYKINHKPKLSSPFVTINNVSKNLNSNIKQSLITKINNVNNKNPFSNPEIITNRVKLKNIRKIKSSKNQDLHLKSLNTNNNNDDDSYIDNILLTSKSDSNKYLTEANENGKENVNGNIQDIDNLCELFKSSDLRAAIIIDEKGNNNLNSEQKNIINNYFNKKNKINSIPVQEYKENKNLFEQKHVSNQKLFFKLNDNNLKNNKNMDKNTNANTNVNKKSNGGNNNKKKLIIHKKFMSNQQNKIKIKLGESFIIRKEKEKKQKKDYDNNSIFENCTNQSIDSSFLGSSLDDLIFLNYLVDNNKRT